ncbi:hypothetical protein [Algibacillus agarilyticus]|nr:hypothetical protein [Algibacillus agarilyticus]
MALFIIVIVKFPVDPASWDHLGISSSRHDSTVILDSTDLSK